MDLVLSVILVYTVIHFETQTILYLASEAFNLVCFYFNCLKSVSF